MSNFFNQKLCERMLYYNKNGAKIPCQNCKPIEDLIGSIGNQHDALLFRALYSRDFESINGVAIDYHFKRGSFTVPNSVSLRETIDKVFEAVRATLNYNFKNPGSNWQYSYSKSLVIPLLKYRKEERGIGVKKFPINVFQIEDNEGNRSLVGINEIIRQLMQSNVMYSQICGFSVDISAIERNVLAIYFDRCSSSKGLKRAAAYEKDREVVCTWPIGGYETCDDADASTFVITEEETLQKLRFIVILILFYRCREDYLSPAVRQSVKEYIDIFVATELQSVESSLKAMIFEHLDTNYENEFRALHHLWYDLKYTDKAEDRCARCLDKRAANQPLHDNDKLCIMGTELPLISEFCKMVCLMRHQCKDMHVNIGQIINILDGNS